MKITLLAISILLLAACAPHRVQTAGETPRHCLKETGTRIAPGKDGCINAAGRSYSREDLERTGMGSTGDALNRAVP